MHLLSGQADRVKRWKHVCLLELRMDKLPGILHMFVFGKYYCFCWFQNFYKSAKKFRLDFSAYL